MERDLWVGVLVLALCISHLSSIRGLSVDGVAPNPYFCHQRPERFARRSLGERTRRAQRYAAKRLEYWCTGLRPLALEAAISRRFRRSSRGRYGADIALLPGNVGM